ncbi:MAG: hypothetical protein GX205_09230 [Firmicutes bacterium]|nr:hypothetical protein [Bacillota bacterium]
MYLVLILSLLGQSLSHLDLVYQGTVRQVHDWDCGIACAETVLQWTGADPKEASLLNIITPGRPISFRILQDYFDRNEVSAMGYRLTFDHVAHFLTENPGSPLLIHLDENGGHFALAFGMTPEGVIVADPAHGVHLVPKADFQESWTGNVLYFPELSSLPGALEAVETTLERAWLLQGARRFKPAF